MEVCFRLKNHSQTEVVTNIPFLPVIGHTVFLFFSYTQEESLEYKVVDVLYSFDKDDDIMCIIVDVESV